MLHKVYVYGTLRGKDSRPTDKKAIARMFDLGWYPGIIHSRTLDEGYPITLEVLEDVDDEKLTDLDAYEGYHPDMPNYSLYLREPFEDGWIYIYNRPEEALTYPEITSGDWHNR